MAFDQVIIGGGLSGIAAGIRLARFGYKVLILEQHSIPGGLNSYYYRRGRLFETGLHAMTNFAPPGMKRAPLNRVFRQLKLSRKEFQTFEQVRSSVLFPDGKCLSFSNDPSLLTSEVARLFPDAEGPFKELLELMRSHDPFVPRPWSSARDRLKGVLDNEELAHMLLWPLMMYGNSREHDMDFDQFVIMFKSIYLEGMFRPAGTMRDFLELLLDHYRALGGEIRFRTPVERVVVEGDRAAGVVAASGEVIEAGQVLSTAGYPATMRFLGAPAGSHEVERHRGRMSFMEMIYVLPESVRSKLRSDMTIIFYNLEETFDYRRPAEAVNVDCGVICFPENFQGLGRGDDFQVRITHPANYDLWSSWSTGEYRRKKEEWRRRSEERVAGIIGNYHEKIVYMDSFTPVTIERFTGKEQGAVYGSPHKARDGLTPLADLFVAGTDQGYLGIIGAMLSGVTMVNVHMLRQN